MRGVSLQREHSSTQRVTLALAFALLGATPFVLRAESVAGVSGRVVRDAHPVASATVYAYQVVARTFQKAMTDGAGEFAFPDLPAGLYKIVAHKSGVPPAVLVLARRAAGESQFVQVELAAGDQGRSDGFWDLRAEVPSDVLRDLQPTTISLASTLQSPPPPRLDGKLTATAGLQELRPDLTAQVSGADLDFRGAVGATKLQVNGEFRNLAGSVAGGASQVTTPDVFGRAAAFDVGLDNVRAGTLGISGENHQLNVGPTGFVDPVDFARYQLHYSRDFGEAGSTSVAAQYVDENGMYTGGRFAPRVLPGSSRLLTVEGTFSRALGDSSQLHSGLRFRETASDDPSLGPQGRISQFLDVWSRGESDVAPALVVQYGLYTTLRDGSVSLLPRGGLLFHLSPEWQASLSGSHRVSATQSDPFADDYAPVVFDDRFECEDADAACYEAQLLRGDGESDTLEFHGSWREFDRTLRVFLRDDFLAAGEGLFFVPGDQLPELHASIRHRLGSSMVARLSSSYADGGGGQFRAANRGTYQNSVVFVTTAVDATFEPTSTGVYLSFQRIDQQLAPLDRRARRAGAQDTEIQRVQLMVSQDLSSFFDSASTWAVRVGMELARGGTMLAPAVENDQYRRSLTTDLAVRF